MQEPWRERRTWIRVCLCGIFTRVFFLPFFFSLFFFLSLVEEIPPCLVNHPSINKNFDPNSLPTLIPSCSNQLCIPLEDWKIERVVSNHVIHRSRFVPRFSKTYATLHLACERVQQPTTLQYSGIYMREGREREKGKKDKQQQLGFTEFPTEQRGARSIVKRLLVKASRLQLLLIEIASI